MGRFSLLTPISNVTGAAGVRLEHVYSMEPVPRWQPSLRINGLLQLAENPLGNPLGTGILVEYGVAILVYQLVQMSVIQALADMAQIPLEDGKIEEHSTLIKLRSPHVGKDSVIVAVEIFALAMVVL